MLKYLILIALVTPASAQQQTPREQAISQKLLREISESVQCSESTIILQQKIADLEKQLEALKKK